MKILQITMTAGIGLIAGALILSSTSALARPGMDGPGGRGMDPSLSIERMTRQFDLTKEQQEKIRGIMESARKEQQRLQQEMREQIDAVLTAEQKGKRDAMMQKRMDRQLKRMTEQLNLTQEQVEKIRAIFAEQIKNPDLSRSEVHKRISNVLTDEQRDQLARGPMPRQTPPERREPRNAPEGD